MTTLSIKSEIQKVELKTTIQKQEIVTKFSAQQGVSGPPGPAGLPGDGESSPGETPIGAINGINLNFALAHTPLNGVRVYLNGMRQKENIDCTISSNIVTFIIPPVPGDTLLADYNF